MPPSTHLRILEVSEPNKDGVFIHVRGLLQHLLDSGHTLTYAFSRKRSASQLDALLTDLQGKGVETKDIKVSNVPRLGDLKALGWLLWQIHTSKPDIVHGHSSKAGALVRLAAVVLPNPAYVYTPHGYYSMSHRPGGFKIAYWWIERALARLALTVNISRDERQFAVNSLGIDRGEFMIAANPVDVRHFQPASLTYKQQMRGRWGISAGAVVFGALARFSEQKNLGMFYRGAIRCAQKFADFHFVHLGSGPEAALYRESVEQAGVVAQFTFIEYLPDPEPFYACLDGFVITSRFEAGWPIVMLEALAVGLPVITTDFVGLRADDPANLSHAWVVPSEDDQRLSQVFVEVGCALREQPIVTNHRAYVKAKFSPEICYGKVEQLYRSLTLAGRAV